MREILFRGMTEEKNWIEGDVIHDSVGTFIGKFDGVEWDEDNVLPETVGQFSGLFDVKGNKIYEGDILRWTDEDGGKHFFRVAFLRGAFLTVSRGAKEEDADELLYDNLCLVVEVVGNMHEHSELMEGTYGN